MASRAAGNWLRLYAEYTSESESPDSYHLWMGLSVLSSVLRRNIWKNQGFYLLFPNMYLVLVGPPGLGKSTTIRLGRRLLLGLEDIIIGPDSVTREELIQFMAKSGGEGKQSPVTLHSTELSSLIQPSGITMIQFMIDIYDSDDVWRYSTKHQGKNIIYNPFLNIVAGTVPKYLAEDFPVQVIGNGFTARTIFAYESAARFANPEPKEPPKSLVALLIKELQDIATMSGAMEWTSESRKVYYEQYHEIFQTKVSDYRLEDFHNRKKIHLLKIAMLLAVAERDDNLILVEDLQAAWGILEDLEHTLPMTFSSIGKYEHATDLNRLINQIREAGELSSEEIYRRNKSVGDVDVIDKMLILAERSGEITSYRPKGSKILVYKPKANGSD